jgi:hypothetical protein
MASVNPIFITPMLKYFQIIEVLSNFGKVNIKYRANLKVLFEALDNLKLPTVDFLRKLGPI